MQYSTLIIMFRRKNELGFVGCL